ncbi:hypothetical protein ABIA95_003074 [Bradyrhizobium sp. LA8.1]|uniref:hypothetical protein n=1 Tax=unclassified Bradyrhizobium TaxID=2631580 RepID=UPI00339ACDF0
MTALTADRMTQRREKPIHHYDVKATTKIWMGALVALNAGYAQGGTTATGLIAVGRAEHYADNSAGANGDIKIKVRAGVFKWNNSTSTDQITRTEIGSDCYIVDDNTVAKTNGSSTRSVAGKVVDVDSDGVWVATGPGNVI